MADSRLPRPAGRARWAVAGLLALVAAAYGQLAVGWPLAGYDVTTYSLPNRVQVSRALRSFHLPQWDPFRFAGAPLLANPQAAALYPPHWLLAALAPDRMQGVSLVAHAVIAALGAYCFATSALHCSRAAAAMAASAFVLGGFFHAHLGQYEQATSMAWLPWAMTAADRAIHADGFRASARAIVGLAAALAMTALAGHPQYLHMAVAAVLLYVVVVARPVWVAARALAGVGLGLALASIQLLPTAQVASNSLRSGGLDFAAATSLSLPLRRAVTAFLPHYLSQPPLSVEFWAWAPCTVLALAVLGLFASRPDRRAVALLALALAGSALALGSGTPAFHVAYAAVPGVSLFRVPARWLLLPSLAAPLLAGRGLDHIGRAVRRRPGPAIAVGAAVAAAAAALPTQSARPSGPALVAAALAAGGAVLAWFFGRGRPRWARGAVIALVVVELLAADIRTDIHRLRMRPGSLTATSSTAHALHDPSGGRVLSVGGEDLFDFAADRRDLRPNAQVFDRLRSVDGYDGGLLYTPYWRSAMVALTHNPKLVATDTLRAALGSPLDPARFAEMDITRAVVHGSGVPAAAVLPPGSAPMVSADGVEVWRTPSDGPVFLEGGQPFPGLKLHRDVDRPERLVVDVPVAASGRTVVVSEAFAPGWRTSRDVGLHRYHDLLMAFTAPSDGGRLILTYRTPGLLAGAAGTLVALVATAALWLWGGARRVSAPSTLDP